MARKTITLMGVKLTRYIPSDDYSDIPMYSRGVLIVEDVVTKQVMIYANSCIRKLLREALRGEVGAHFTTLYDNPLGRVNIYAAITDVDKTEFLVACIDKRVERKLAIGKAKQFMKRIRAYGEGYKESLTERYGAGIVAKIERVSMEDAPKATITNINTARRPTSSQCPSQQTNYIRRTGRRF